MVAINTHEDGKPLHTEFTDRGTSVTTFQNGATCTVFKNDDVQKDGNIIWRNIRGEYNRVSGPAVEYPSTGHKEWWRDGKLHREDGPAIERPTSGNHEYWLEGRRVERETVEKLPKQNLKPGP